MKISYNWLKWYIPDAPLPEKLADVFTYHLCEVETVEQKGDDYIFDINVLPNRAHDLLSHQGVARELASLLNIKFVDPTPKYKVPQSKPTKLNIDIRTNQCRRYIGRIIRNVKVGPSPEWVVKHLESIGQRSINNIVDATNIVMFDCGQPAHVLDLAKVKDEKVVVRLAHKSEKVTLLDGTEKVFSENMMTISDYEGNSLGIAGVKGGKYAELTGETTNIVLETANFNPTSVRKTAQALNTFTDARKRFENDLSPELDAYGMLELSALIYEMYPEATFEDIVDIYPEKQKKRKLSFSTEKISKILGLQISKQTIEDILKRYNFTYTEKSGTFEILVPFMRLDLTMEEDMAEEIGRILGYDKLIPKAPQINFEPKQSNTNNKIVWARNELLSRGYSEVMTYVFRDTGEVSVLASASDKKFLRTNLADGVKDSLKLNTLNAPLLGLNEIKIFEIGTIFKKDKEEIHVAFAHKGGVTEVALEEFCHPAMLSNFSLESRTYNLETKFKMWSLFPFIARDIALWVPATVTSDEVAKIIKENMGDMVVRGPELFDQFKKGEQISYAFRLVFQSYERTLTDVEVNEVMSQITNKIKDKNGWQVR